MITPGQTILIDMPGNPLDNKKCLVTRVEPEFNLAPDSAAPLLATIVFASHPSLPTPVGFDLAHIAGTAEASRRRTWDAAEADDQRQGELLL